MPDNDGFEDWPPIGSIPINTKQVRYMAQMTLRDYFAGQALVGLLTNPVLVGNGERRKAEIAEDAFMIADTMMETSNAH